MLDINTISKLNKLVTPFWFYDMELLERTVRHVCELSRNYGFEVHYAVKANVQKPVMRMISSYGLGADCVSGNEILYARDCGFAPDKIVFAGVGKTDREIGDALTVGILAFNCESLPEIEAIDAVAGMLGVKADISLRINPDIDAHTHKFVTTGLSENKFGIAEHEFEAAVRLVSSLKNVRFTGLHFHIGSQITDVEEVFAGECRRANEIVAFFESRGLVVEHIDLGGGLGVNYEDPDGEPVPDFRQWFDTIDRHLVRRPDQKVLVEPGRSIVAQCCSLFTRVTYVKNGLKKKFLITDSGMNDLIRPALYGAYHKIENVSAISRNEGEERVYDVVGHVCESSDVWGEGRVLPLTVRGDLLAIRSAGAYGQVMSSRYNLRDFAPAVYSDSLPSVLDR